MPRAARPTACRVCTLRRRPQNVVEERAKLRAAQFNAGIGDGLNQPFEIEFGADRDAGPVEHLKRARLFTHSATRASSVSLSASRRASSCLRSAMLVEGAAQQRAPSALGPCRPASAVSRPGP